MNVMQDGKLIGKVGLCMKRVGPCRTCRQERSLMYAMFHPEDSSLPPKAATCSACCHQGGPFRGLLSNLPKVIRWKRKVVSA